MIRFTTLVLVCLWSLEAVAHPGHGNSRRPPASLEHFLWEPIHMLPIAFILAVSFGLAFCIVQRKERRDHVQRDRFADRQKTDA